MSDEKLKDCELAREVFAADLRSIGLLCEMRDDEYPLKAVMRVVAELSEWRRKDRYGGSIYGCRQCRQPAGLHKLDCSYRNR